MSDTARVAAGSSGKSAGASYSRPDAETHAPYEAEGGEVHTTHTGTSTTGWRLPETLTVGPASGDAVHHTAAVRGHRSAESVAVPPPPSSTSSGRQAVAAALSVSPSSAARCRPSASSASRASAEGPSTGGAGGPGRHVDPSTTSHDATQPAVKAGGGASSSMVPLTADTTSQSSPLVTSGGTLSGSQLNSTGNATGAASASMTLSSSNGATTGAGNGGVRLSAAPVGAEVPLASGHARPNFSTSAAVPPPPLPQQQQQQQSITMVGSLPPMPPPPPPPAAATTAQLPHGSGDAPAEKERDREGKAVDSYTRPAVALTAHLLELYKMVNAQYCAQRRLESPGPKYNSGYDDKDGHYLFLPGEVIFQRYIAQEVLGKGSFGTVIRGFDQKRSEAVAMKITRRGSSFRSQAKLELDILLRLNENPALNHLVVRLLKVFEWQGHLVLVFELLSFNLYQLIKCTRFNGVSLDLVRKFAYQLTHTLLQLESQRPHPIIHCDLKPENILLRNQNRSGIRLIDFGSACYTAKRFHRYIQSRFYRSPEVILFLEYGTAIDRWSLACVLVELHTGVPLFDGRTEAAQLAKFECTLGPMPAEMIAASPKANRFYYGSLAAGFQLKEPVPERRTLESVMGVTTGGPRGRRLDTPGHDEKSYREFYDFIAHFLRYQPEERMSCREALQHPFLMPLYTSDLLQQQEREAQHRQQGAATAATQQPKPTAAAAASQPALAARTSGKPTALPHVAGEKNGAAGGSAD